MAFFLVVLSGYVLYKKGRPQLGIKLCLISGNLGVLLATGADIANPDRGLDFMIFILFAFAVTIALGGLKLGTILYLADVIVIFAFSLFIGFGVEEILSKIYLFVIFIPLFTHPMISITRSRNLIENREAVAAIETSYDYFIHFLRTEVDDTFLKSNNVLEDLIEFVNNIDDEE